MSNEIKVWIKKNCTDCRYAISNSHCACYDETCKEMALQCHKFNKGFCVSAYYERRGLK